MNLGHSLGHALESHYHLPHGVAVSHGLLFALKWSQHQGYLRAADSEDLIALVCDKTRAMQAPGFRRVYRPMSRARLRRWIVADKKMTDARNLNFVFLEKVGVPFCKVVSVESLLTETQRQGWTAL